MFSVDYLSVYISVICIYRFSLMLLVDFGFHACVSGGFRGGRAGFAPTLLGDGLTPSLTVMSANAEYYF